MVKKELLLELNYLKNILQYDLNIDLKDLKKISTNRFLFEIVRGNEILDYYDSEIYKTEYEYYAEEFLKIMYNLSLYIALENILVDEDKIKKGNYIDNFIEKFKDKMYEEFNYQTIESLTKFSMDYIFNLSDNILRECYLEEFAIKQNVKNTIKN